MEGEFGLASNLTPLFMVNEAWNEFLNRVADGGSVESAIWEIGEGYGKVVRKALDRRVADTVLGVHSRPVYAPAGDADRAKLSDEERLSELTAAFEAGQEVWLDRRDLRLIGREPDTLNAGERISSESDVRHYSAAWV